MSETLSITTNQARYSSSRPPSCPPSRTHSVRNPPIITNQAQFREIVSQLKIKQACILFEPKIVLDTKQRKAFSIIKIHCIKTPSWVFKLLSEPSEKSPIEEYQGFRISDPSAFLMLLKWCCLIVDNDEYLLLILIPKEAPHIMKWALDSLGLKCILTKAPESIQWLQSFAIIKSEEIITDFLDLIFKIHIESQVPPSSILNSESETYYSDSKRPPDETNYIY